MILYHFTARQHLDKIEKDGVLTLTESNISAKRPHSGPDVVWLTKKPDWPQVSEDATAGHNGLSYLKTAVRITVNVNDPKKWRPWAESYGISQGWMRRLAALGGSHSWYVVTKPIYKAQWVAIDYNPDFPEDMPMALTLSPALLK